MPQESQSYPVNFVADVHLIQVLGEQLIGSEKVGILELVKNAYDAGATRCDIWIEKVPGLPEAPLSDPSIANLNGPVITIIDDGSGMNETVIRDGWLRPATQLKTSAKERMKAEKRRADERQTRSEYEQLINALKKEYGGRLPLGEKGVGRFATHRLGQHVIIQTKTKDEPYEWALEIDWANFSAIDGKPRDLHTVPLTLTRREPTRDYGPSNSGTMIRVYGGKDGYKWEEKTLIEIGSAVGLVRSPAKAPSGFVAEFHCPQISKIFEPLTETVPAPFVCVALVDEQGYAEIDITFTPPASLIKPMPSQTWRSEGDLRARCDKHFKSDDVASSFRKPECGPFYAEIKLWIREKEWIDFAEWKDFTDYLDEFGGIGIYRDGFSILPAQTAAKEDWLKLAARRIKKIQSISYYQLSGSIDIMQEQTLELIDRTSREGMVETIAFKDLGALVLPIVYELEIQMQGVRDRYKVLKEGERIPETTLNVQSQAASRLIAKVSEKYDFNTDPFELKTIIGVSEEPKRALNAISNSFAELRREIQELRAHANALIEAAGYGIAISVAMHEIEKITSNIFLVLNILLPK